MVVSKGDTCGRLVLSAMLHSATTVTHSLRKPAHVLNMTADNGHVATLGYVSDVH